MALFNAPDQSWYAATFRKEALPCPLPHAQPKTPAGDSSLSLLYRKLQELTATPDQPEYNERQLGLIETTARIEMDRTAGLEG